MSTNIIRDALRKVYQKAGQSLDILEGVPDQLNPLQQLNPAQIENDGSVVPMLQLISVEVSIQLVKTKMQNSLYALGNVLEAIGGCIVWQF